MPIYDMEFEMDLSLGDKIKEMAEAFGPDKFLQVLNQMDWVPKNTTTSKPAEHVLLQEAVEYYFSSDSYTELAKSSKEAYRYEMGMFIKFCNKHFQEPDFKSVCTSPFLGSYLAPVKNKNTRSKKAAFLRNFLRTVLDHFYEENINKLKRVLKVTVDKRRLPRAFTKEQIDELIMLARLGRESFRNFVILWTFLGTGIRLSELRTLQVGDIKPQTQEIYVRSKGEKEYKTPSKITEFSLELLNQFVKFRYGAIRDLPNYSELYVFSDNKGISPLHDSTIQKMLANLIEEASTISDDDKRVYQLSVHSLRHSFALYLLESGVDPYTIQQLLRHKWLSSTEVYLKLFDDTLVKVINQHPLANLKVTDFF
ncbi:tyrosine-type recombinase/integrase [Paenibacillus silagei]|uniref:Integrase/recombinase XerD n=1 Tax=Paenibacillus silagei TaxID=1670801 RepID=A0ABS4NXA2_9BACL|nr:tyrosine-type recombinase/integrase [Paenibacillus silagei]MBP2114111.1 integrase/recombinase XerD [Paenibacillus silagei]